MDTLPLPSVEALPPIPPPISLLTPPIPPPGQLSWLDLLIDPTKLTPHVAAWKAGQGQPPSPLELLRSVLEQAAAAPNNAKRVALFHNIAARIVDEAGITYDEAESFVQKGHMRALAEAFLRTPPGPLASSASRLLYHRWNIRHAIRPSAPAVPAPVGPAPSGTSNGTPVPTVSEYLFAPESPRPPAPPPTSAPAPASLSPAAAPPTPPSPSGSPPPSPSPAASNSGRESPRLLPTSIAAQASAEWLREWEQQQQQQQQQLCAEVAEGGGGCEEAEVRAVRGELGEYAFWHEDWQEARRLFALAAPLPPRLAALDLAAALALSLSPPDSSSQPHPLLALERALRVRDYASLAQQLEADALAAVPALSPALIHSLCLRLPLDDLPQILLIVHFHSQMHPLGPRGPLPLPAPLLPPKPELVRAWNELCQKAGRADLHGPFSLERTGGAGLAVVSAPLLPPLPLHPLMEGLVPVQSQPSSQLLARRAMLLGTKRRWEEAAALHEVLRNRERRSELTWEELLVLYEAGHVPSQGVQDVMPAGPPRMPVLLSLLAAALARIDRPLLALLEGHLSRLAPPPPPPGAPLPPPLAAEPVAQLVLVGRLAHEFARFLEEAAAPDPSLQVLEAALLQLLLLASPPLPPSPPPPQTQSAIAASAGSPYSSPPPFVAAPSLPPAASPSSPLTAAAATARQDPIAAAATPMSIDWLSASGAPMSAVGTALKPESAIGWQAFTELVSELARRDERAKLEQLQAGLAACVALLRRRLPEIALDRYGPLAQQLFAHAQALRQQLPELEGAVARGFAQVSARLAGAVGASGPRGLASGASWQAALALGDAWFELGGHLEALRWYLQGGWLESRGFAAPEPPAALEGLYRRMISCCCHLRAHLAAFVLCQFLPTPDFFTAFKVAQEDPARHQARYFPFVWEPPLLELLLHLQARLRNADNVRFLQQLLARPELNQHNPPRQRRAFHALLKTRFLAFLHSLLCIRPAPPDPSDILLAS